MAQYALALSGCTAAGDRQTVGASNVPVCAEVDRGEWTAGAEIVIPDDPDPPCRLILDTVVIRRYSAAEIDSLDLSRVREVDRHGNFYVQGYEPGVITVLSPTGERTARFGHEGPGPGEFPQGHIGVEVSDRDSIYIYDNRLLWTIFGPDRRFVRSMPMGAMQAGPDGRCVLADGSVVSSAAIHGGTRPATLRLFDPGGDMVAEFGKPHHQITPTTAFNRKVNCGLDDATWTLPSPVEPGYRLERWGPDGTLLSAVTRDADWFDAGPPMDRSQAMRSRPPSEVEQVVEVHRGLLFTIVVNADPRWEPVTRDQWNARLARLLDVRYEALDAISGRLLAVLLVDDAGSLPNAPIMWDGRSFQIVIDDSGGAQLTAYALHLVRQ